MTSREARHSRRAGREAQRPKISLPPGLEGGRYRPLSDEEVQRIHAAALTVLEQTGVEIVEEILGSTAERFKDGLKAAATAARVTGSRWKVDAIQSSGSFSGS